MSTRKYVEVPEEFTGKPLEARITSITHSYKYADIFLDIFLPGDAGSVSLKKRIWTRIPNNSKTDFSKQNEAAFNLWRNILAVPDSIDRTQMVENMDELSMLDMLDYRLEVSMEPGEEGRRYLKVISYDVVPLDWEAMCREHKSMLLEKKKLEKRVTALEDELEQLRNVQKGAPKPAPVRPFGGMESVKDYI